jgi:pimeloyl-ACP methyl ester carboxylesterase
MTRSFPITVHWRQENRTIQHEVAEGDYILRSFEAQGDPLPFSCRNGCCTACAVRVLGGSKLGRRVLRGLLGAEVGSVSNPRAWADESSLTPGVVALYRRPLRALGWDYGLISVSREAARLPSAALVQLCDAVRGAALPAAVLTGSSDRLAAAAGAAARLGGRLEVIPRCGRLAYEEQPAALTAALAELALEALAAQGNGV